MNFRFRVGLATVTLVSTGALYAEGVIKTGWVEAGFLVLISLSLIATGFLARSLPNLLISIAAISLTLTMLDLVLRPTFGSHLHYTPTNISSHKLPELPIVGRWDENQTFDIDSYGDLAAMAGDPTLRERRRIVFRTDEFGFRNAPRSESVDILILGDSFPAGGGTTDDETFASVLRSKYGYRTYNLSYPGGPYDQFINFAIEWERLKVVSHPKMIWTFYTGNDLEDEGGNTWDIPSLPWRHGIAAWRVKYKTFRNRSPLNQWMEAIRLRVNSNVGGLILRWLPNGQPVLFVGSQEAAGKRSYQEVQQHPNFAKLTRTLAAMRTLTTERNVELTILVLPTKGEVYRWLLETRNPEPEDSQSSGFALAVLEACQAAGIACRDTKPYLISEARRLYEAEGKLLWWRDDTHIGTYGHAALAAYIADKVLND